MPLSAYLCFGVLNPESEGLSGCEAASKGVVIASIVHTFESEILIGGVDVIVTFDTHLPLNERL